MTTKSAVFVSLCFAVFLAGCGHSQVKSAAEKPDYAPVTGRALSAQKKLAKAEQASAADKAAPSEPDSEPTLSVAPEAAAQKAKVLGKDREGCTWLESEATVTVGLHDTQAQVKAAATAEAERSAMRDFLGVDIRSRSFDFQQEGMRGQQSLIENLLQTTRLGRVLKEEIVQAGYPSSDRYHVKLKTCIMPIPQDSDRDFKVELGVSQNVFLEGNEAKLTVTASRDCWVYLYDVGLDGTTSLIIPNEMVPEARLKAGDVLVYPNDSQMKNGVHLVAQMPDDKTTVSAETIRVIATKTALPKKIYEPTEGSYLAVLRRVNAKVSDWTEDVHAFTILKP